MTEYISETLFVRDELSGVIAETVSVFERAGADMATMNWRSAPYSGMDRSRHYTHQMTVTATIPQ